jgi:hypothetical protein
MRAFSAIPVVLWMVAAAQASEADMAALRTQYEKDRDELVEQYAGRAVELADKYILALQALRQQLADKGDTRTAALAEKEIERFGRERKVLAQSSETTVLVMQNVQRMSRRPVLPPQPPPSQPASAAVAAKIPPNAPAPAVPPAPAKPAPLGPTKVHHNAIGAKVTVSSTHKGEPGESEAPALVDGDLFTRWSSDYSTPQEVTVEFPHVLALAKIRLHWEQASATRYSVYLSTDGKEWKNVYLYMKMQQEPASRTDEIALNNALAAAVRLDLQSCISTNWGFSLYEIEVQTGEAAPVPPKP